jgi:hypothetical protein
MSETPERKVSETDTIGSAVDGVLKGLQNELIEEDPS